MRVDQAVSFKRIPNTIPSPVPADYDRQVDFTSYEANFPNRPIKGTDLDAEFNAIERALDETQDRLALIQRDDGNLKNGIVTRDSLEAGLATSIADIDAATTRAEEAAEAAEAAEAGAISAQQSAAQFAVAADNSADIAQNALAGIEEAVASADLSGVDFLNFSLNDDGELIVDFMGVVSSNAFAITADGFLEVTI